MTQNLCLHAINMHNDLSHSCIAERYGSTNDIATLKGCFAVNSCLLSYSSMIIPTIHAIVRENRLNSYFFAVLSRFWPTAIVAWYMKESNHT